MNSRQSWLLSCLSEKNCRRCMYRYAWATRTLRAVVARLCLLCMQMSSPIHVLSHRRHSPFSPTPQLVQPFSLTPLPFVLAEGPISARAKLLAVVFVSAEEPISARAKLLFLRGVVCLWRLPLLFASSAACLWRLPLLFASSAASSKCAWRGQGRGQEAMACAISPFFQKLRVTKQFALSLILICCGRHAASRPAV